MNRHQFRRMLARNGRRGVVFFEALPPLYVVDEARQDSTGLTISLPPEWQERLETSAEAAETLPAQLAASMLVDVLRDDAASEAEPRMIEVAPGEYVNEKSARALGLIK